jgi:hypothetical protein
MPGFPESSRSSAASFRIIRPCLSSDRRDMGSPRPQVNPMERHRKPEGTSSSRPSRSVSSVPRPWLLRGAFRAHGRFRRAPQGVRGLRPVERIALDHRVGSSARAGAKVRRARRPALATALGMDRFRVVRHNEAARERAADMAGTSARRAGGRPRTLRRNAQRRYAQGQRRSCGRRTRGDEGYRRWRL